MTGKDSNALVVRAASGIQATGQGPKGILSGMVGDALALARHSGRAMVTKRPFGAYEFSENNVISADHTLVDQLSSGIDPKMMRDGINLVCFHIKSGAYTFAALTKAMIDDLGDGVKPYLKSWYMAVKYDLGAKNFYHMDDAATVEAFNFEILTSDFDTEGSGSPEELINQSGVYKYKPELLQDAAISPFEEDIYTQVKPLLLTIVQAMHEISFINSTLWDIREAMKTVAPMLIEQLGIEPDIAQKITPYINRFIFDVDSKLIKFDIQKFSDLSDQENDLDIKLKNQPVQKNIHA